MSLQQDVSSFLSFFRMNRELIDRVYGRNYNIIGWNWDYDGNIMRQSHLAEHTFQDIDDFLRYIEQLRIRSEGIDYYPTFLRIIDMINLPLLDKKLERIFLGKPDYECSN
jgi:hypothetical protein